MLTAVVGSLSAIHSVLDGNSSGLLAECLVVLVAVAAWITKRLAGELSAARVLVWGLSVVVAGVAIAHHPVQQGAHLLALPLLVLMAGLFLGERAMLIVATVAGVGLAISAFFGEVGSLMYLEGILVLVTLLTLQLRRNYLTMGQEISVSEERAERWERDASVDITTGLPNRRALITHLDALMLKAAPDEYALLLVNLDRFHTVNHGLGHEVGDSVLLHYACTLRDIRPTTALVARLTGDEFAIVSRSSEAPQREADVLELGHAVLDALQQNPYGNGDGPVVLTASVGAVVFPSGGDVSRIEVLRRGAIALNRAKQAGGNRVEMFHEEHGELARQRFELESELQQALGFRQLRLFVQSQVNQQGAVVAAECLLRWEHPTKGIVMPSAFLPISEESDLIVALGLWVMEQACVLQVQMEMRGLQQSLSINISPRQFLKPDFETHLDAILVDTGANPARLMFEITESLVMHDLERVIEKMRRIQGKGLRFSIDDFGTGYSSLSYLKKLPVSEIKIAMPFVQDAPHRREDAVLVRAIASVAEHMGLDVVAEGVETSEQAAFLNSVGPMRYQGFLFSRPVLAHEWLREMFKPDSFQTVSGNKVRVRYLGTPG